MFFFFIAPEKQLLQLFPVNWKARAESESPATALVLNVGHKFSQEYMPFEIFRKKFFRDPFVYCQNVALFQHRVSILMMPDQTTCLSACYDPPFHLSYWLLSTAACWERWAVGTNEKGSTSAVCLVFWCIRTHTGKKAAHFMGTVKKARLCIVVQSTMYADCCFYHALCWPVVLVESVYKLARNMSPLSFL